MNFAAQANSIIMNNLPYILAGLTVLIFLSLIIFININLKLARLNKRYRKMMQGMEGANIERLLMLHMEEVRQAVEKVDGIAKDYSRLYHSCRNSVQHIGIVRFNAFEDTGSDLSFALALLDGNQNGVVLSSIFGRNESRTYAKPIVKGQSSYFLTDEEKQALEQAQAKAQQNTIK